MGSPRNLKTKRSLRSRGKETEVCRDTLCDTGLLTASAIEAMRKMSSWDIVYDRMPIITDASPSRRAQEVTAFRNNHHGQQSKDIGAPAVLPRESMSPKRDKFEMPGSYISMSCLRREIPDYDMDTDDEDWLAEYNKVRKTIRSSTLNPEPFELAMSYIVAGKERQLRAFACGCDVAKHLDAIEEHATSRLETERDWIQPAILKKTSDKDGPYACFMDYDVLEEPMAVYLTPKKKISIPMRYKESPSRSGRHNSQIKVRQDRCRGLSSPPRQRRQLRRGRRDLHATKSPTKRRPTRQKIYGETERARRSKRVALALIN